ncbi:MAG TPA: Gfo/Idh/MocA family oxidoreductase [Ruania sp.]|nr:Gfo/Idh/MocA family oxidoreductase [Ruania sp.]
MSEPVAGPDDPTSTATATTQVSPAVDEEWRNGQEARIGIVGLGTILRQYLDTFERAQGANVVAVADLDPVRATEVAARTGARAVGVAELVDDGEVDVVLNLTVPAAHAEIAQAALAAGKQVYGEKPLAATSEQAGVLLAAAEKAGLRTGGAPDTVLGTGVQTARAVIDAGTIGVPVAANATFAAPGHERWHPNPDFYYLPGGGPLMDMGPYYLTALVTLLGGVTSVIGAASTSAPERVIGSGPRAGEHIPVQVATHVTGVLTHAGGALSTIVMSFDSVATQAPRIEVHGSAGSLSVPDPNGFDGPVRLRTVDADQWQEVAPSAGYLGAGRGVGLLDLVRTPRGRDGRASGALAAHVLQVMEAVLASAEQRRAVPITTRISRPAPVPLTRV